MKFRGMWLPLVAALALPGALRAQEEECPCRERPGMIGVIFDAEDRESGVRIVEVRRGSPADRAGVRQGDVVVHVNGENAVTTVDELPRRLQAGDTVRLRVRRDGGEREVVVVAEARPATQLSIVRPGVEGMRMAPGTIENMVIINGDSLRMPLQELTVRIDSLHARLEDLRGSNFTIEVDSLVTMFDGEDSVFIHRMPSMPRMRLREGVVVEGGMPFASAEAFAEGRPFFMELGRRSAAGAELAEMNEGLSAYFGGQREGALVIEVSPESPAARAGLQPGDVIVRAGGQDVEDPADVREALNRAEAGQVAVEVIRQGRRQTLSLEWTGAGDRLFHRERVEGREPVRVRERVRVRTRAPEN
jgi:predicted metalloprotease with PDZ domain